MVRTGCVARSAEPDRHLRSSPHHPANTLRDQRPASYPTDRYPLMVSAERDSRAGGSGLRTRSAIRTRRLLLRQARLLAKVEGQLCSPFSHCLLARYEDLNSSWRRDLLRSLRRSSGQHLRPERIVRDEFIRSSNPAGVYGIEGERKHPPSPRFIARNTLPAINVGASPATQTFPYHAPLDNFAITWGLDSKIKTPYSETFDLSVQRELPGGFTFETAYVGRLGQTSAATARSS